MSEQARKQYLFTVTHGVTQENMLLNAQFMGGAAVIGAAENRQTFSYLSRERPDAG